MLRHSQSSLVVMLIALGLEMSSRPMQGAQQYTTGTFTATGNTTTARADHTATLLLNGKVLIAGGAGPTAFDPSIASAELYDPATGTFTATGNMTTVRQHHTATLLANGKVLITGGRSVFNGPLLASAELYDPSSGTFTPIGDKTSVTASWGTAILLGNGKVLVTGVPTAELYDPATGTFTATGAYAGTGPEFVSAVTLLPDSRVLITGVAAPAGWTELYHPGTGTFSPTSGMNPFWDGVNTATLLVNGKVLFVGESDPALYPADAEVYDPAAGTFTSIGYTTAPRGLSTATLLPDGAVLIAGGQLPGGNGLASTERYAPETNSFDTTENMTTARAGHTATLLLDGTVLIAGGFSVWPRPTSSAEIYKPPVLQAAPVLFSLSQDRQRQGAIWHAATGQLASADNPAIAGEALSMYCTSLVDGGVIPPQVAIGGRLAEILFFGNAPGYPGFKQVNFRVPSGVAPGTVSVRLTYLGRPSNEVIIGVK